MTAPTKEDFELHLRHLDDRLEATAKLFDDRLDAHRKLFAERTSSDRALFAQWRDAQQKLMDDRDERFRTIIKEAAEQARSLKIVMVTTAIATTVATVGGVAAFNATLLSNMVASFESGSKMAALIVEAKEELKQIQNDVSKNRQEVQELVESLRADAGDKKR